MVFEVAWIMGMDSMPQKGKVMMGWQPLHAWQLIPGVAEKKLQPLFLEVLEVQHQGECRLTCPLAFYLALYLNLLFLLFLDEWFHFMIVLHDRTSLQTKNTGNLLVHSSVQGDYWSHPEWSLPVTSLNTSVMLLYTNVREGYQSLPIGYRKLET